MNKKIFSVLSVLLSLTLLSGCTLNKIPDTGKDEGISQASISGITSTTTDNSQGGTDVENPDNTGNDPANTDNNGDNTDNTPSVPDVDNNGGNFIGIDGKVYFRQYAQYTLPMINSRYLFVDGCDYASGNRICRFDPSDPDNIEVVLDEDSGFGKLYYYDGWIYCESFDWGEVSDPLIRLNINTGERETFGAGRIDCASADGKYLVVESLDPETNSFIYDIYEEGQIVNSFMDDYADHSLRIMGIDDSCFYYAYNYYDDCSTDICQTDFRNGNSALLASIPVSDTFGDEFYIVQTEPIDVKLENGNLNFELCFCTGAEDYVEDAYTVSVPICQDMSSSSMDAPLYEAKCVKDTSDIGSCLLFPTPSGALAAFDKAPDKGDGFAKAVQTVDEVYGKYYVIVADSYKSAMWNEAQFGSFDLLSIHYYQMDDNNSTPVEFNKDNPTFGDLMVKGWLVGEQGKAPEKMLFCYSYIDGPEGPFEDDQFFYVAEFADDFVYDHVPENGDIYDDFVKDGMDYFVNELSGYDHKYISKLPAEDDIYNYKTPKEKNNGMETYTSYYHIHFDSEGKIDYLRYVIFD